MYFFVYYQVSHAICLPHFLCNSFCPYSLGTHGRVGPGDLLKRGANPLENITSINIMGLIYKQRNKGIFVGKYDVIVFSVVVS